MKWSFLIAILSIQLLAQFLLMVSMHFTWPDFSLAQVANSVSKSTSQSPQSFLPLPAKDLTEKLNLRKKTNSNSAIVFNLWASWCEPCKLELPELVEIRKNYKNLELILLTGDVDSDLKEASDILKKVGVDFPTYKLTESPDQFMKNFIDNWSSVVPTTIVFDKTGRKIATWVGRVKKKDLEEKLKKLAL